MEFWTSIADRTAGPILEIGCGTGRVGLEIARRGHSLWGVDQSEEILNVFRHKLSREDDALRQRVRLYSGDMRSFAINTAFSLALIPFRPLQHMLTLEDQVAALSNMRRHLAPNGLLAFDVFFPRFSALEQPNGIETLEREWTTPDGHTIRRFFLRHRVDKVDQIIYASFIFRTYAGTDLIAEEISPLNMSYYTCPHLRLLLQLTGFEMVEEYGSFQRDPVGSGPEIILVAKAV